MPAVVEDNTTVDAALQTRCLLEELASQGIRRIAMWGAGKHTHKIITSLLDLPLEIAAFIDDDPAKHGRHVCGWPIVSTRESLSLDVQAVIINSDCRWDDFRDRCAVFENANIAVHCPYDRTDQTASAGKSTRVSAIEASMFRHQHLDPDSLHAYWSSRGSSDADAVNDPRSYRAGLETSVFVSRWFADCGLPRDAAILELGCNIGRNLAYLHCCGYSNLSAIEINAHAVEAMNRVFAETAAASRVQVGSLEQVLPTLPADHYDMVFSTAVLEHIPEQSSAVFAETVRVTGEFLCTIEDEHFRSPRHFPRDYGKIFADLGMQEVKNLRFREADPELIQLLNLDANCVARLFVKA